MAGVTPNIRLFLPTYDQPGWDTQMNANLQILDSLVARAINLVGAYTGIYNPGGTYTLNSVVTDPADSSLWQANSGFSTLASNTFAQERAANPSHWTNVTSSSANAAASAALAAGSATTASANAAAALVSQNAAAASQATATAAAAAASAGASFGNVGRNLIHNALFRVLQRGTGSFTATGAYTADRWQLNLNVSTINCFPSTLTDSDRTGIGDEAATTALSFTEAGTSGAADYAIGPVHKIEKVKNLSGKTVTLSFWAKASTTGKFLGIELVQFFGTGGSPSTQVTNIGSQTIALSAVWARYSVTIALPTTSGKVLGTNNDDSTTVNFWLSSGSANLSRSGNLGVQSISYLLWGVQLEVSPIVSPLEKLDLQTDTANCQRFYQIGGTAMAGYGITGTSAVLAVPFPVNMRAIPTTPTPTWTNTNITSPIFSAVADHLAISGSVTATGNYTLNASSWTASADL